MKGQIPKGTWQSLGRLCHALWGRQDTGRFSGVSMDRQGCASRYIPSTNLDPASAVCQRLD